MPRLVSMARSGETFITHDERHGMWLHLPPGAGGAGPLADAAAARAVADHGFLPVDREFATWAELDDYRLEVAARSAPAVVVDPSELDGDDVAEMLDVARRWLADQEGDLARRLALALLRAPVVLADAQLHERVVSVLEAVADASPVVRLRDLPSDGDKAAYRRRWEGLVAAA